MRISKFSRIDTVTVPDKFMSVIRIDDGEPEGLTEIKGMLEADKDSLDYLGVASDTDPLDHPDIYKIIKEVKPKGLKVMLVTDGRDPTVLDDLIGAGYTHAVDLLIGREVTPEQSRCMSIAKDNGCKFAITVEAKDHDGDSLSAVALSCKDCSMVVIKQDKTKPLSKSDMSKLVTAAKKCTWNVRTA